MAQRQDALVAHMLTVLHHCRFGAIAASGQAGGFGGYFFTRDMEEVVQDLLLIDRYLGREVLLTLPQWQGVKHDPVTEEQPDRLPHQEFSEVRDGRYVTDDRIADARHWTDIWGVEYNSRFHRRGFVTYNTTDGTPRYVDTVGKYVEQWGTDVLSARFDHHPSGETRTIADATVRCADWVLRAIEASDLGLLETTATNPRQTSWSGVMRDGNDSYYHPVGPYGAAVNRERPIAYVEVQGLAYDALLTAARLFPGHPHARAWRATAEKLPQRLMQHFWMEDKQFFAAAVDRDEQGNSRKVELESSAAFELMGNSILKAVRGYQDIVSALMLQGFSPRWMTEAGPTMLPRDLPFEGDYLAYQGNAAVWGVLNGKVVGGAANFALGPLARHLGLERFLPAVDISGAFEHLYVPRGGVEPVYFPNVDGYGAVGERPVVLATAAVGQLEQTWTASAVINIADREARGEYRDPPAGSWQAALSRRALEQVADIPTPTADRRLTPFVCDVERGAVLAEELVRHRAAAARELLPAQRPRAAAAPGPSRHEVPGRPALPGAPESPGSATPEKRRGPGR